MKKTIQFIAMATLCLFLSKLAWAQITPLKVGDKMPDLVFKPLLPHQAKSLSISDLEEKLIILSFWSTNCPASTKLLSELTSLERKFSGDLKVISAGKGTTEAMIRSVLDQNLSSFTFTAEDSQLNSLFPHNLYPHLVWIGPERTILGITSAADLNGGTVQNILDDLPYSFSSVKSDRMDYQADKPLFSIENGGIKSSRYHSVLSDYINGLPAGMGIKTDSSSVRITAVNQSLLRLYFMALKLPMYTWPLNRIDYQDVNPDDFIAGPLDQGKKDKAYCYELSLPLSFKENIHKTMQEDLQRIFKVGARIEKRLTPCYVLSKAADPLKLETSGAKATNNFHLAGSDKKVMLNSTLFVLTEYLQTISEGVPVINETDFKGRIDLSFEGDIQNLSLLNENLNRHGLKLEKTERNMDFLVFYAIN